jgi:hypothetical protein
MLIAAEEELPTKMLHSRAALLQPLLQSRHVFPEICSVLWAPAAAGAVGAAGAVFRWMGMTRADMMSAMRSSGGDGADFLTEAISK